MLEKLILAKIKTKRLSFSELEKNPPKGFYPRDVRITVQALLDEGKICLDDNLKCRVCSKKCCPNRKQTIDWL